MIGRRIWRNLRTWAVILIGILPALAYLIAGARYGFYLAYGFSALFFVYLITKISLSYRGSTIITWYLLLVLMGAGVGFANVLFGDNSIAIWFEYTTIHALCGVAIVAGFSLALRAGSSPDGVEQLIMLLGSMALAESLSLIPRFLILGADIRTSLGSSLLFPALVLAVTMGRDWKWVSGAVALLLLTVFFLISILSGMRSVLFAAALMSIHYVMVVHSHRRLIGDVLAFAVVMIGLLGMMQVTQLDKPLGAQMEFRLLQIEHRFNQTLLNRRGMRLDEGVRGREREANDAMRTFFASDHLILDVAVGKGFGFYFRTKTNRTGVSAHVHLTSIAYFVRNGIFGILFLCAVFLSQLYFVAHLHLSRGARVEDKLMVVMLFTATLVALIAGVLLNPIYWFMFGLVLGRRQGSDRSTAGSSGSGGGFRQASPIARSRL